ncbi:MAG TPA: cytochrome c oxidase assembly protein, partial [Solirubrobacterales bacterium]|nr:cytochrome c oxidase assembly protein [Solirubrobacterales bacterium]
MPGGYAGLEMTLPFALAGALLGLLELIPLVVAAGLYAKRSATLAAKGRPVPLWRQLCFAAGLLTVFAAIASPIDYIAEELVIAHMIEHLLIGDIASLLLVLGLTGPLLQPVLAIKAFDRLKVLAHPLIAFPLWAAIMFF